MTPTAFLELLMRRGGSEHQARLLYCGQARGLYRLTSRGARLQVVGPQGAAREISREHYLAVFGAHGYGWAEVTATGTLTDIGPLFAAFEVDT